jgi:hypothetical protein
MSSRLAMQLVRTPLAFAGGAPLVWCSCPGCGGAAATGKRRSQWYDRCVYASPPTTGCGRPRCPFTQVPTPLPPPARARYFASALHSSMGAYESAIAPVKGDVFDRLLGPAAAPESGGGGGGGLRVLEVGIGTGEAAAVLFGAQGAAAAGAPRGAGARSAWCRT